MGIFSHPDPFVRFSLYITATQGVRYIAQAPASEASERLVDHFPIDAVKSRLLARLILFIGNRLYREPIGGSGRPVSTAFQMKFRSKTGIFLNFRFNRGVNSFIQNESIFPFFCLFRLVPLSILPIPAAEKLQL